MDADGFVACQMVCTKDEPPPDEYECSVDTDCAEGLVCEPVLCTGCACPGGSPDCDCAEPVCYGYCVEPKPEPIPCAADTDCPEGMVCEMGPGFAVPCGPDFCPEPTPTGQCVPAPSTECKPTGCSGQICADSEVFTTCEWKPWYACFALSECGNFGEGGTCGWEENDAFLKCLEENGAP
jgi:eight-cysteine-cluster-containing protein